MSLFLLGMLAGAVSMFAIFITADRCERRKPESATPVSIQTLFQVRS